VKNTPRQPSSNYSSLVGTPYSEKDCWGIVVDFYQLVFGITLNSYYTEVPQSRDITKNLVYSNMGDFQKVEFKDKQFGDIFLIKLYGVESHIAICLGNETLLHTTLHSGCCIERLARWEKTIVGVYRVKEK
jgi:cell wall-associated NlpC family hydrolase